MVARGNSVVPPVSFWLCAVEIRNIANKIMHSVLIAAILFMVCVLGDGCFPTPACSSENQ